MANQGQKAKQLLNRIGDEIEKWVSDETDPLYGLSVMIERDDRGAFATVHIRVRKTNVEKRVKKPTAAEGVS